MVGLLDYHQGSINCKMNESPTLPLPQDSDESWDTTPGSKKEVNRIDTHLMQQCIKELALRFNDRNANTDDELSSPVPAYGALN